MNYCLFAFLFLVFSVSLSAQTQAKGLFTFYTGITNPLGGQRTWQQGAPLLGTEIGLPLKFTKNQLWILTDMQIDIQPGADFTLNVPTETGPANFQTHINNTISSLGGKLRYHINTKTHFKPFLQAGGGIAFNKAELSIEDPRENQQVCYPMIFDYNQRTRTPYISAGGGIMLHSLHKLSSPSDGDGDVGIVLSVNYMHGFQALTVYPAKPVRSGEPAVNPKGTAIIGQFRNPVSGQEHAHQIASAHTVQLRSLQFMFSFIFGGDIGKKKKREDKMVY